MAKVCLHRTHSLLTSYLYEREIRIFFIIQELKKTRILYISVKIRLNLCLSLDLFSKTFEIKIFFSAIIIIKAVNKEINFFMVISDEQDYELILVQLIFRVPLI